MESLGDSFGDAFITLPLLIIGFIFFLGIGNTGEKLNFKNMLYYFLSWGAFMLIHSFGLKGVTGSDLSHIVWLCGVPSVFLHVYFRFFGRSDTTNTFTFLDLVNIPYWLSEERSITESAPACNLLPSSTSEESPSKSTTASTRCSS